jgi:hypothetical protein
MRKPSLAGLALFLFLLWPPAIAEAQPWPSRPIRFVISFGPGSASDAISRILAQELTTSLGQPVVIVHKPGADGTISGTEVQRSPPDGYTFLFGTNSALAVAPALRKSPPYNVLTDFVPISLVGLNTLYFVVGAGVPANSMAELVAYAKANPGKINAATGAWSFVRGRWCGSSRGPGRRLRPPHCEAGAHTAGSRLSEFTSLALDKGRRLPLPMRRSLAHRGATGGIARVRPPGCGHPGAQTWTLCARSSPSF